MDTILVSDIHGKAPSLEFVLKRHPRARVVCLGDAVGQGDNDRVLAMLPGRTSTAGGRALCVVDG